MLRGRASRCSICREDLRRGLFTRRLFVTVERFDALDFGKADNPAHLASRRHSKSGKQNRQQPDDSSRSHLEIRYSGNTRPSGLLPLPQMSTADISPGWKALRNSVEVEDLMSLCGHFHDACVREIHVATGHYVDESLSMTVDWKTTIHMLIQMQSRRFPAIELRFEEVVGMRLSAPQPDCDAIIFAAAFFVRDGIFYWAENGLWTPESAGEDTWVAARKVLWRDARDWLGPSLRYRDPD